MSQSSAEPDLAGTKKAHRDRMFFSADNSFASYSYPQVLERKDFFVFCIDAFLYRYKAKGRLLLPLGQPNSAPAKGL